MSDRAPLHVNTMVKFRIHLNKTYLFLLQKSIKPNPSEKAQNTVLFQMYTKHWPCWVHMRLFLPGDTFLKPVRPVFDPISLRYVEIYQFMCSVGGIRNVWTKRAFSSKYLLTFICQTIRQISNNRKKYMKHIIYFYKLM